LAAKAMVLMAKSAKVKDKIFFIKLIINCL